MIAYLLKSSLSLLVLFGFYKLWLENKRMHFGKRVYLLASLLFSVLVPLLALDIWPATGWTISTGPEPVGEWVMASPVRPVKTEPGLDDTSPAYWLLLYGCVTAVLLIRFVRNIYVLTRRISDNPKQPFRGATLVRLREGGLPHTFLHYLFVSEAAYSRGEIEEELFTHELTHIRQRHSLDVLFVELLICVGWFNPLLIGLKRAIQLNHEFLADDAVNRSHQNVTHYQRLLLGKLSPVTLVSLTSTLTFQTTKQRLIMMTKHTSRAGAWLAGAGATLLFGALTLLLGTTTSAQTTPTASPPNVMANQPQPETDVAKMERLYGNNVVRMPGPGRLAIPKKFSDLTPEEKKRVKLIPPDPRRTPTEAQWADWKNSKKFGIWINGKRRRGNVLNAYQRTDIASFWGSYVHKNARQPEGYQYQFELMTNDYYDAYLKNYLKFPILIYMADRSRKSSGVIYKVEKQNVGGYLNTKL